MMKTNMHPLDRMLRLLFAVVVGIYIFYVGIEEEGLLQQLLPILAIVFGLTGLINFCPLYKLFGINTAEADQQ